MIVVENYTPGDYVAVRIPALAASRGIGRVVKRKNAAWDARYLVEFRDPRHTAWFHYDQLIKPNLLEILALEAQ